MASMSLTDSLLWGVNCGLALGVLALCLRSKLDEASGLVVICQSMVACLVFSVMTIRANQETPFRPDGAKNIEEEFQAYGYPSWFCKIFRIIKSCLAIFLAVGVIWEPGLVVGAGGILVLMIGAVISHIRVRDPVVKSVPSFTMGCMCAAMLFAYHEGIGITAGVDPVSALATSAARWWFMVALTIKFAAMTMTMMGVQDLFLWLGNLVAAAAIVTAVVLDHKEEASGLVCICQCLVGSVVFSVMTVRVGQETPFRPDGAKTLEDEFKAYGYPAWFFKLVRFVKSGFAVLLIAGLVWTPGLLIGSGGILILMIGAVGSHIKVGDAVQKSVPSFTLGCMCAAMLFAYSSGCTQSIEGELPPSILATSIARKTACASMGVLFMGMLCEMLRASSAPKCAAREALLSA